MPLSRLFRTINRRNIRLSSSGKKSHINSAGIIVIGDELLKGEVSDTNSPFLAKELHKLGLKLKKISVIPDDVRDIRDEVSEFSSKYDYVLTTGGIGPTHDDVTYEGVALAFDEPLVLNPDLKAICSRFYKTLDPLSAGMKLAYVPKSSKLHYDTTSGTRLKYPNVSVQNVYMFPGIPELLKKTILEAGPLLFHSSGKFFTKCLYCKLPEHMIVEELNQAVVEFPDVQFGCYPQMFHNVYKVKVTIESCQEESTMKALSRLRELMPENCVIDFDDV